MKLFKTEEYVANYVCVRCEHILSRAEVMYSDGVCPYCGNKDDSTICDYIKVARLVIVWVEVTFKPPFIKIVRTIA